MYISKPQNSPVSKVSFLTILIITICFFLSGFTALVYQASWLRQFSILFGTSEIAVATILAAYMAGLGIGAKLAGLYIDKIRNPIFIYGVLEAGIAISALAVPFLLDFTKLLFVFMLGEQPEPPSSASLNQTIFYLISTFIIISIPTILMGATLPLLSKNIVSRNEDIGPRISYLYGFNTIGAVAGTLLTGFVFIPEFGLSNSISIAVFGNFLIFIIIAVYSFFSPNIFHTKNAETPIQDKKKNAFLRLKKIDPILPIIMLSGAISFLYEVLWTRMLSHLLGGTIYAFAVMLGSFLAGIALGSVIASRFSKNQSLAIRYFSLAQIAIALLSIIVYQWMSAADHTQNDFLSLAIFSASIILPSTLFIGCTFPLAVRILATDTTDVGVSTARVYTWNTFGAILGALAAGYFILPTLGFEGSIKLAVSLNVFLAIVTSYSSRIKMRPMAGISAGLFLVILLFYSPDRPATIINSSTFENVSEGEEIYYAVGRSATVMVNRDKGNYFLKTNGLPEAVIRPKGAPPVRQNQKWLMALPTLARPDALNALVIGFGGGVMIENIPSNLIETDVIELEKEVIDANTYIGAQRANNPLDNPNINIIVNDARNALSLTEKTYDIIISQPSHPWTAGASHLYTKEFISLAKNHLNQKGVFLQWINASFIDGPLLKTIAATLKSEFSNVRLYEPDPLVLMFLASDSNLEVEKEIFKNPQYLLSQANQFSKIGIRSTEDLLAALSMDDASLTKFIEGAPINTDNNNQMATRSNPQGKGLNYKQLYELTKDFNPLLEASSWIYDSAAIDQINHIYIAERQIAVGMSKKALDMAKAFKNRSEALTMMGLGMYYHGNQAGAATAFFNAVQEDPQNDQANFMLIRPFLARLARKSASEEVTFSASNISSPSAKAVLQGWQLGINRMWDQLADLDEEISKTKPTDSWLPQATKIRIDWRLLQNSTKDKVELGKEIMTIADEALLFYPTVELFIQRASGALLAKDSFAFIETISSLLAIVEQKIEFQKEQQYTFSSTEATTLQNRLTGINTVMEQNDFIIQNPRSQAVQRNIEEVIATLSTIKET